MASVAPIRIASSRRYGVRLADDDVAGAGVADDRGGHQADRPGAGDQHVLAEDREGERRVDRVAERVEDRGDLLVDARPVVPDVGHRQGDVLGERAVPADAEADRVGAQVAPAGQAVAAAAADHVALAADRGRPARKSATLLPTSTISPTNSWPTTSGGWIVLAAHGSHDSMWRSVPQMPGLVDPDQDVVDADRRLGDVAQARGPGPAAVFTRASMRRARRQLVESPVRRRSASSARVVGPVDDRILHRADALDLAADAVARLEEDRRVAEDADARRACRSR